jgi:uncharacterized protein YndB with AHSA1/START domain
MFAEQAGRTELTLHASVSKLREEAALHPRGMEQGWSESLDRLAERLTQEVNS